VLCVLSGAYAGAGTFEHVGDTHGLFVEYDGICIFLLAIISL
jgi:hypothetical protein